MQEQWEIRWMDYYLVFQLQPDAEQEVISVVYKKLAAKYHPDNKATGNEAKFKELNEANEVLTNPARRSFYDKAYAQRQLANGRRNQTVQDEQRRRAAATQKAREEQQRQEEQARQRQQEEEARRKKQLPIVYPLFQQPSWYRIYDYLVRSSNGAGNDGVSVAEAVAFFAVFLFILLPPVKLLSLFASSWGAGADQFLNSRAGSLGGLGLIGLWGTFVVSNLFADYSLYKIQTVRAPRTAWLEPRRVWTVVEQALHRYRYHGHGWIAGEKTEDGEDATEKLVARLAFSYKLLGCIDLPYAVTVTIKVKESTSTAVSQVCYWFDEQRPWFWLLPAAAVVKQTNTLLLKVLAGEALPPEEQPLTPEKRRANVFAAVLRLGAAALFIFVMGFLARLFSTWLEQLKHEASTSFADVLLGLVYFALSLGSILAACAGVIALILCVIDLIDRIFPSTRSLS